MHILESKNSSSPTGNILETENYLGKELKPSTSSMVMDMISTEVERQGRAFGIYSPIIYWIGWLAILYIVLYAIAVYIGPVIFGSGSNYPYYYGRNLRKYPNRRETNLAKLTSAILPAIEKVQ